MKTQTLLIATLPLPPGINELYATTRTGKRILTEKGEDFKQKVLFYLTTKTSDPPFAIDYLNPKMLEDMRDLYSLHPTRKVRARYKFYVLETLLCFQSERQDIDGPHKVLQDTIFEWLCLNFEPKSQTVIKLFDNRIARVTMDRVVNPHLAPHCEVWFYEREHEVLSGDLIHRACDAAGVLSYTEKKEFHETHSNYTVRYPVH